MPETLVKKTVERVFAALAAKEFDQPDPADVAKFPFQTVRPLTLQAQLLV